jgi:hypothetical protein
MKCWKRLKPYHISGIFCGLAIVFVVIGSILQATGQPKNATDAMWALVGICGAIFVLSGIRYYTDTQIVRDLDDPGQQQYDTIDGNAQIKAGQNAAEQRKQQQEAYQAAGRKQGKARDDARRERNEMQLRCELATDDFFTLEPLLPMSTETKSMWLLS